VSRSVVAAQVREVVEEREPQLLALAVLVALTKRPVLVQVRAQLARTGSAGAPGGR
jgi:hypothetical protein